MGSVPGIKSMVNSASLFGGKPEISYGKTSGNSLTMGCLPAVSPLVSYLLQMPNNLGNLSEAFSRRSWH